MILMSRSIYSKPKFGLIGTFKASSISCKLFPNGGKCQQMNLSIVVF